jgi:hypothetical protein
MRNDLPIAKLFVHLIILPIILMLCACNKGGDSQPAPETGLASEFTGTALGINSNVEDEIGAWQVRIASSASSIEERAIIFSYCGSDTGRGCTGSAALEEQQA